MTDDERIAEKSNMRMNAYYYSFGSTGDEMVDRVLSAVACAGKAYHHTRDWCDETEPYEDFFKGSCPVEWIFYAAEAVAKRHAERQALVSRLTAELEAAKMEVERLDKLVYVPGVWKCAKCGGGLVSTTLDATNGLVKANNEPQQCPNGCGPMWRRTERDAGNELCDRMEALCDERNAAQAELEAARKRIATQTAEMERLYNQGNFPETNTIDDVWQELVEKDDRTSPEECPDMALITREELASFMARAAMSTPQSGEGG